MVRRVIEGTGKELLEQQGLADIPEVWEDGLRTEGKRGLFEWWYFYVTMENETTLTIIFYTRPILQRNDSLNPFISVAVKQPNLPARHWMVSFPPDSFNATKEYCDIRIGDNWVRGDLHVYNLHVDLNEISVDLDLIGTVKSWRPGTGMNFYDESLRSFFAWIVPVPLGEVKGRLRLDGKEILFQGDGYHDHNWGNVDLNRVLSKWYWGRFYLPPYMGIFAEMTATPAYDQQRMHILMVARENRVVFEAVSRHIQLETADFLTAPSGHSYPTYFKWIAEVGECQIHLVMRDSELIGSYSLLDTLPTWKRRVARLLGKNPYYLRFLSRMTMELKIPEAQEILSGPIRYEIMHLT